MNLRTQIIRGQAVSWFLVLLLSGVVFVSIQQSLTSAEQRRQALAQLTQIEVIKTDALDLETGMRGYLLTADTQFLEPFDRARANFGQDIDAERALIPTDGKSAAAARAQSVMLDTIQAQVNLWLTTIADPSIDNVKSNPNMAVNIPLQVRGKEMIDQVRSTVETYRGDETAILNGRIDAAYRMLTILKVVTGIGLLGVVVSSLLSGLWLAGAMTKPMARLVRGAQHLADGALDERVPVSGARELTQVARAFNEMAEKLQASQVDLAGQNAILTEQASTLARSSAIEHTFSDVLRAFTASYDGDAILKICSRCSPIGTDSWSVRSIGMTSGVANLSSPPHMGPRGICKRDSICARGSSARRCSIAGSRYYRSTPFFRSIPGWISHLPA